MENSFLLFAIIGFFAQLVDGTLGMGYGVTATSFLLSVGGVAMTPALASASVHCSELFTTAFSGLAHLKFGNVDKQLVSRLLIPGVIGGSVGAYILTSIDSSALKPYISAYLIIMGIRIIVKSFRLAIKKKDSYIRHRFVMALALFGGFFDATGGGGWGPIVTTHLITWGKSPNKAIGSVNLAEFFVTLAQSITFVIMIGALITKHYQIILGLLLGGCLAAPFAASLTNKVPTKPLMILVGILIVVLSARTLLLSLGII